MRGLGEAALVNRHDPSVSRRAMLRIIGASLAAPVCAARADSAKLVHVLSLRPQNGPIKRSDPDTTTSTLYNLDAAPEWVRLVYLADSTAYSIDGAAIAMTGAVHDSVTPVDSRGQPSNALWQRVTFDSDGDDSPPGPAHAARAYSLAVPMRRPAIIGFSDWIKVSPMPRSDAGYGFLMLVRAYSKAGLCTPSLLWEQMPNQQINRAFASSHARGNASIAPWDFAPERDVVTASFGLQFVTRQPGATVVGIGDSIMSPPEGKSIPYAMRACALVSRPDRPVSYVNNGRGGALFEDYLPSGAMTIKSLKPQIAVIQAFTSNDPMTMDAADHAFEGAMRVAAVARAAGCEPIIATDSPEPQISAAAEAVRQHSLARVRGLASRGYRVLDLDALWGAGGGSDGWKQGYAGDRWHPANPASVAAAQVLAPMFEQILRGG